MKTLRIAGDLIGGSIRCGGRMDMIQIRGELAGTEERQALISAHGVVAPSSLENAMAITRSCVGGSVTHAQILAGYDTGGSAKNADAGMGSLKVGGGWIASDVAAGVAPGVDGAFGTDDDELIHGGTPMVARIAFIQVMGVASSSAESPDAHYGFAAEEIVAFKLAGDRSSLVRGPGNDQMQVGSVTNLTIREV